ncbi:MAG TPA: outer membrane beta-barrel protein [Chitinophagales bacterium]|nr:outer membrane beta-barrel protein [Chitinophagales bacterium]
MKQSQNKNFDQFVKGKLENASVEAPAFIWDKIERQLPPVLPWYSKYKYLLLLLLLSFVSATSVVTYKYIKGDGINTYALNHSSSEQTVDVLNKVSNATSTKQNTNNNDKLDNIQPNTLSKINNPKNTDAASVSAFYQNQKSDNSSTKKSKTDVSTTALEKRNKRINRFDTKKNNGLNTTNVANSNESTNTTTADYSSNIIAVKSTVKSNKLKNNVGNELSENNNSQNNFVAGSDNNASKKNPKKINQKKSVKETTTEEATVYIPSKLTTAETDILVNELSTTNENTTDFATDISPIVEPIQVKESEELLVSITPLKLNTTPLKSRDVLRSLIEPNKLETLDFNAAVGVEDLNPNKEKMMRNLKQFAGYNINQGFHIGAFISINNIWLSNKSFSCSENVSSIKPKIDFGKSYGLNIGYDYNDHWGIELEAQYAEQGQKYSETSVSMNAIKEINLNYLKFPLMVKYKQSFINNYNSKPIVMSFLFGPQMGFLLKKETLLNKQSIPCNQGYSKVETGLAAGIDFDLYMMRYMYLTIGARTGFGTSFKKGVPVSYQLGITTQFNFRIPKKIK